jgi:hypothetical protein
MNMNMPKEPAAPVTIPLRRVSSKTAILAGLVGVYLLSIYALGRFGHLPSGIGQAVQLGLSLGLMAVTGAFCIRWWRNKDEAQQEAQKWAWYWGGASGLAAVLPILFAAAFAHDRLLSVLLAAIGRAGDVGMAFRLGIIATLVPMCVGAFIARAIWWRRHR